MSPFPAAKANTARARAYLAEVDRFAGAADARLAAGRGLSPDEWKALAAHRAAAEQAWAGITGK